MLVSVTAGRSYTTAIKISFTAPRPKASAPVVVVLFIKLPGPSQPIETALWKIGRLLPGDLRFELYPHSVAVY